MARRVLHLLCYGITLILIQTSAREIRSAESTDNSSGLCAGLVWSYPYEKSVFMYVPNIRYLIFHQSPLNRTIANRKIHLNKGRTCNRDESGNVKVTLSKGQFRSGYVICKNTHQPFNTDDTDLFYLTLPVNTALFNQCVYKKPDHSGIYVKLFGEEQNFWSALINVDCTDATPPVNTRYVQNVQGEDIRQSSILHITDTDGNVQGSSLKMGTPIRLLLNGTKVPGATGIRPISCTAHGSRGYPILVMGCGTGDVIGRGEGFITAGLISRSPVFKIFLVDGVLLQFECNIAICSTRCDGNTCERNHIMGSSRDRTDGGSSVQTELHPTTQADDSFDVSTNISIVSRSSTLSIQTDDTESSVNGNSQDEATTTRKPDIQEANLSLNQINDNVQHDAVKDGLHSGDMLRVVQDKPSLIIPVGNSKTQEDDHLVPENTQKDGSPNIVHGQTSVRTSSRTAGDQNEAGDITLGTGKIIPMTPYTEDHFDSDSDVKTNDDSISQSKAQTETVDSKSKPTVTFGEVKFIDFTRDIGILKLRHPEKGPELVDTYNEGQGQGQGQGQGEAEGQADKMVENEQYAPRHEGISETTANQLNDAPDLGIVEFVNYSGPGEQKIQESITEEPGQVQPNQEKGPSVEEIQTSVDDQIGSSETASHDVKSEKTGTSQVISDVSLKIFPDKKPINPANSVGGLTSPKLIVSKDKHLLPLEDNETPGTGSDDPGTVKFNHSNNSDKADVESKFFEPKEKIKTMGPNVSAVVNTAQISTDFAEPNQKSQNIENVPLVTSHDSAEYSHTSIDSKVISAVKSIKSESHSALINAAVATDVLDSSSKPSSKTQKHGTVSVETEAFSTQKETQSEETLSSDTEQTSSNVTSRDAPQPLFNSSQKSTNIETVVLNQQSSTNSSDEITYLLGSKPSKFAVGAVVFVLFSILFLGIWIAHCKTRRS